MVQCETHVRVPSHERLLELLNMLIAVGGIAQKAVESAPHQHLENYHVEILGIWVDEVALPNGHGEACEIALEMIEKLEQLRDLAIYEDTKANIGCWIARLRLDYIAPACMGRSLPYEGEVHPPPDTDGDLPGGCNSR